MTIFQMMIFVIAALQVACVGPRTYTEQEKAVLAQTKTIWIDVQSDSRTIPSGLTGIVDKVEHDVKEKLTRAGLTVAPDKSSADAVLQLALQFSHKRAVDEPAGDNEITHRRDARSVRIDANLEHKEVGEVFWHSGSVSPPYDVNLPNSTVIRSIDSDVLQALFKSTPAGTTRD